MTLDPGCRWRIYSRSEGEEKAKMRAALESLLRARKLDVTLTDAPRRARPAARAARPGRRCPASTPRSAAASAAAICRKSPARASSGRTTIVVRAMAAAAARGEAVALVDACDTFDPASAAARGLDLSRVLWVRGARRRGARAESLLADPPGRRLRARRPRSRGRAAGGAAAVSLADVDADRADRRGQRHGGAARRRRAHRAQRRAASPSRSIRHRSRWQRHRPARASSPASNRRRAS